MREAAKLANIIRSSLSVIIIPSREEMDLYIWLSAFLSAFFKSINAVRIRRENPSFLASSLFTSKQITAITSLLSSITGNVYIFKNLPKSSSRCP